MISANDYAVQTKRVLVAQCFPRMTSLSLNIDGREISGLSFGVFLECV